MRRSRGVSSLSGFTLIELMIVIAVVGILVGVAIPWLVQARMSANEASAITALGAINDAQAAYQASCGRGRYAATLPGLGQPVPTTGLAFISPDLSAAEVVIKGRYLIAMGSATPEDVEPGCNGADAVPGYHATADPATTSAGRRHFGTNTSGTLYHHTETLAGQMPDQGRPPAGAELK